MKKFRVSLGLVGFLALAWFAHRACADGIVVHPDAEWGSNPYGPASGWTRGNQGVISTAPGSYPIWCQGFTEYDADPESIEWPANQLTPYDYISNDAFYILGATYDYNYDGYDAEANYWPGASTSSADGSYTVHIHFEYDSVGDVRYEPEMDDPDVCYILASHLNRDLINNGYDQNGGSYDGDNDYLNENVSDGGCGKAAFDAYDGSAPYSDGPHVPWDYNMAGGTVIWQSDGSGNVTVNTIGSTTFHKGDCIGYYWGYPYSVHHVETIIGESQTNTWGCDVAGSPQSHYFGIDTLGYYISQYTQDSDHLRQIRLFPKP